MLQDTTKHTIDDLKGYDKRIEIEAVNWQKPDERKHILISTDWDWDTFSQEIEKQTGWKPRKAYFVDDEKSTFAFGGWKPRKAYFVDDEKSTFAFGDKNINNHFTLCIVDSYDIVITTNAGQSFLYPMNVPLSQKSLREHFEKQDILAGEGNVFFEIDGNVLSEEELQGGCRKVAEIEGCVEIPPALVSHRTLTSRQISPTHQQEIIMLKEEHKALEQALQEIMLARQTESTPNIDIIMRYLPNFPLIKKNPGEKHIAFIGNISSGKSTLIAALTGVTLKVSPRHWTPECKEVWRNSTGDFIIWDGPTINEDFKIYDPNNLAFLKSLDTVILVYNNSLKAIPHILKTCNVLSNNIICVRTCCDNWRPWDPLLVDEVRKEDLADMSHLIGKTLPLFFVSAKKKIDGHPNESYDLPKLMTSLGL